MSLLHTLGPLLTRFSRGIMMVTT